MLEPRQPLQHSWGHRMPVLSSFLSGRTVWSTTTSDGGRTGFGSTVLAWRWCGKREALSATHHVASHIRACLPIP